MSQQEGDGEIGHSVGFNGEMQCAISADTEEIDKASCPQIREALGFEDELGDQDKLGRSHATKEIDDHLREKKETTERRSIDSEVMGGLGNSGLSMGFDPVEAVRRDADYDEDVVLPGGDDRSLGEMKSFSNLAVSKAKIFREKLEGLRKSVVTRCKVVNSLSKDAADPKAEIVSQGLESSLTKLRESTLSKTGSLEELKVCVESTRSHVLSSGQLLQDVEAEATSLQGRKAVLATGNGRLSSEIEESIRLQEILRQVQKRTLEITKDLETLKTEKKEELASFVKAKEKCLKRREALRCEGNQLYSYNKEKECEVAVAKTIEDKEKRSLVRSENATDEVQTLKPKNDKDEVASPAESELQHVACEKQAATAILGEYSSVRKETSRLAELRRKRESIRTDFESKRSLAHQEKAMNEVQKAKLKNHKDGVEVALPEEFKPQHRACEKQAAKVILGESSLERREARLAELRSKRESIRKDLESKRGVAESDKVMDEVQKAMLENENDEAKVTRPDVSELQDLACEKRAAKAILGESSFAGKETSRLAELRSKRESMRRDFESKRVVAENGKAMDEVRKAKLKNDKDDKDEVEVTLPAESEVHHLAFEKQAAKVILEESRRPTERVLVRKETSRLAELRSKRENIRKNFESKRAQLKEHKNSSEVVEKQATVDLDSLRMIAHRLAETLGEEKVRMDQLKARRAKRSEAFRKLEVLRYGTAVIQGSKQVERDLSVY